MTSDGNNQLTQIQSVVRNNPTRSLDYLEFLLTTLESSQVSDDDHQQARNILQQICNSRVSSEIQIEYIERMISLVEKYRLEKSNEIEAIQKRESNRSETVISCGELLSCISDCISAKPERFELHSIISRCATHIADPHPFISFHAISAIESAVENDTTRAHICPYIGTIVARAGGQEGYITQGGTYNINSAGIKGGKIESNEIVDWDTVRSHSLNLLTWIFIYTPTEILSAYIPKSDGLSENTEEDINDYIWKNGLQFESVSLKPSDVYTIDTKSTEENRIGEHDIIGGKPTIQTVYNITMKSINRHKNDKISSLRLLSALIHHSNEYSKITPIGRGDWNENNGIKSVVIAESDHQQITVGDVMESSNVNKSYTQEWSKELRSMILEDSDSIIQTLTEIIIESTDDEVKTIASMTLSNAFTHIETDDSQFENSILELCNIITEDEHDRETKYTSAQTLASAITELDKVKNDTITQASDSLTSYAQSNGIEMDDEIIDQIEEIETSK